MTSTCGGCETAYMTARAMSSADAPLERLTSFGTRRSRTRTAAKRQRRPNPNRVKMYALSALAFGFAPSTEIAAIRQALIEAGLLDKNAGIQAA